MHILDSLNRGGAEMLALDLCRNARANNLDLTLVATGGGELEEDFRRSGIRFVRLQRRLPVDLKLVAELRQIIKRQQVEIVHGHQAVEAMHFYLATRESDVKRVMSFHLCTADAKNRLALKFLVPRMHANVAVSNDLLNCLKTKTSLQTDNKFHVVYNGVDPERLKPTGQVLRTELGLTKDDLLLGMVGNFYPDGRKDQLTICRSLPRFFEQVPKAHFAFVGGRFESAPEVFDECVRFCEEQNISGRVHFLGKRADIPNVLESLDVYVHSAVNESLGIAVVEAMLLGRPTVVSDIGALLEVTDNGRRAIVFRTGDKDDLADRLIELANDPTRRAQLAAEAKQWALSRFSIESHIKSLRPIYETLLSDN